MVHGSEVLDGLQEHGSLPRKAKTHSAPICGFLSYIGDLSAVLLYFLLLDLMKGIQFVCLLDQNPQGSQKMQDERFWKKPRSILLHYSAAVT